MKKTFISYSRILFSATLLVFSMVMWNCENPGGSQKPNSPPNTRISNVPPDDSIAQYIGRGAIPEFTINWLGDDEDGFVIAYHYRWTDQSRFGTSTKEYSTVLNISQIAGIPLLSPILVQGSPRSLSELYRFLVTLTFGDPADTSAIRFINDSLGTRRPFAVPYEKGPIPGDSIKGSDPIVNQSPTRGTFIFSSLADSNLHTFEVSAVDDYDSVDPTPAIVRFWTLPAPAPRAIITSGPPNNRFALRCITDTWPGLAVTFSSLDPSTFEQEYSWAVDDTTASNWSPWNSTPGAIITASDFRSPGESHTMHLRARNRWGVVSRDTTKPPFLSIVPPFTEPNFPGRILIINNSPKLLNASHPLVPDSNTVNAFYREIMDSLGLNGKYDLYTTPYSSGVWPDRRQIINYSTVVLLTEQRLDYLGFGASRFWVSNSKQLILREFLSVGGRLITVVSPNTYSNFFFGALAKTQFDVLASEIFHAAATVENNDSDFVGARGVLGYPDFVLDQNKIYPDSLGSQLPGIIRGISVNFPRGFGETISLFDSRTNKPGFENAPLGIRFLAPPPVAPGCQTYSVVYFGLPLFYCEKSVAIQAMRKAFQDLNEL